MLIALGKSINTEEQKQYKCHKNNYLKIKDEKRASFRTKTSSAAKYWL